jgi:hypothetical protein
MRNRDPKPFLFLDVDGVLNRCGTSNQGLESDKCEMLGEIIKKTECKIIITSSWRRTVHQRDRIYALVNSLRGVVHDMTNYDRRLEKEYDNYREIEILEWMTDHFFPERFVILDDDAKIVDVCLTPHLVRTDSAVGLTPELVQQVIHKLNHDTHPI